MRGRLLPLTTLAVAACALVTLSSAAATTSNLLVSTASGIHLYAPLQRGPLPSSADFASIAHRFNIVIAPPPRLAKGAAIMHAANPNVRMFVYENGVHSSPHDPKFPTSWYLHGPSGQLVEAAAQKGSYLMNPLSTAAFSSGGVKYLGWATYLIAQCKRDLPATATGCFLDTMGTAPLATTYNKCHCLPIDPRTHKAFTDAAYLKMTGALAARVHTATGRPVLVNGLGGGQSFYGKQNRILTQYVQGGQAQEWMTRGKWAPQVQLMLDTQRAGAGVLVSFNTASARTDAQLRMLTLATYLLGNDGLAYLSYSQAHHTDWQDWTSIYATTVGTPLTSPASVLGYIRGGVYQRRFSHGIALVNPGSKSVTVALGATYHTLGGKAVTSVKMAPMSGDVLVR